MTTIQLERLYTKVLDHHQRSYTSSEVIVSVRDTDYYESPFSLLLELIAYFIAEYHKKGKIEFKIWHVGKNIRLLAKVILFFAKLYRHYFPEVELNEIYQYKSEDFV